MTNKSRGALFSHMTAKTKSRNAQSGVNGRTAVLFFCGLLAGVLIGWWMATPGAPTESPRKIPPLPKADQKDISRAENVLVVYSFFDGDEESWGNLEFFVDQAVHEGDGGHYLIVLNGMDSVNDERLPLLPKNAEYVLHKNECYDWGTYAWVLQHAADPKAYDYFIFINSSVRGPIRLPSSQHWTRLFTDKITKDVKLVGPAISCEHFCLMEESGGRMVRKGCRQNAHVQSVALATDKVGLKVLRDSGYVLRCHKNRFEAVYYGEIGASLAILEAGYNIGSFLLRYQGVDWRSIENWECNDALSPIGKRTFDGLTISALEMVFPKLKGSLLESGLPSHYEAWKLSQWLTTEVSMRNITGNQYATDGGQSKAEDVLLALRYGSECFDWDYYLKKNLDMAGLPRPAVWNHFLNRGAVEFREHRWKCKLDLKQILNGKRGVIKP